MRNSLYGDMRLAKGKIEEIVNTDACKQCIKPNLHELERNPRTGCARSPKIEKGKNKETVEAPVHHVVKQPYFIFYILITF